MGLIRGDCCRYLLVLLTTASLAAKNPGWEWTSQLKYFRSGLDRCNIKRVGAATMSASLWAEEFEQKEPVILTFERGADSWTDSNLWRFEELALASKPMTCYTKGARTETQGVLEKMTLKQ